MKSQQKFSEESAKEFARRFLKSLGRNIHSIVLYGSVARGEAGKSSDIDILIIGNRLHDIRDKAMDIAYQIDVENNFSTLTIPIEMNRRLIERKLRMGSFFIKNIIKDGLILYDNGTYKKLCKEARGKG